jgi:osmotically-inducible protein OsmY
VCKSNAAVVIAIILAVAGFAGHVYAQERELKTNIVPGDAPSANEPPKEATHSMVNLEKDSASAVGHHHYNSPAERAKDDLCITAVKATLADDDISTGYPVEVDCDHGTVILSGVVATADDVRAAAEDALDVPGVVGVRNLLKPH